MLINEGAGTATESQEEDPIIVTEGDEFEGQSDGDPDPLDVIEDETTRNHMKGLRAKERRDKRKPKDPVVVVKPVEAPTVVDQSNYATKDDLKKMATIDAKKLVAPEVKELWDELTSVPLGGYDPMDAESIAKNMAKRMSLYLSDNPEKAADIATRFQTSTFVSPGAGGSKKATDTDKIDLPGFKEPVPPDQWYPDKK